MNIEAVLSRLGLQKSNSGVHSAEWHDRPSGGEIESVNPSTGEPLAHVATASRADYDRVIEAAVEAFHQWRTVPPPVRGDFVRRLGMALRERKQDLGLLVCLEAGKIRAEGEGEIQEMIDMCDFATGLSRQLYGLTIASERPAHRMFEQWHPLGPVGTITAFNFPVAVWAWNAALATVCGDSCVWKPSSRTPLTAIAVQHVICNVAGRDIPRGLFSLCIGNEAGPWMAADGRLPLISATGSCAMGRKVGTVVAGRLGQSLLELGGNNAIIVTEHANLDLAQRAVLFAAVGTAGQRCTSLRRLFVHESIADSFVSKLIAAYKSIRIGNPWDDGTLMGPLISQEAVDAMMQALKSARSQGGEILYGGDKLDRPGYFVSPSIVRALPSMPIVRDETFAPILYVITYRDLAQAIEWHNSVSQGLSSAIFTDRIGDAERFLSVEGSDCGIANVNIGTSGAEIGGAFGGEKDTGGGREAGSDAWKAYMRRQTCTLNWGNALPLAQGIVFDTTN